MKDRKLARPGGDMKAGVFLAGFGIVGRVGLLGQGGLPAPACPTGLSAGDFGHLAVAGYLLAGGLGAFCWRPWGGGAALGAGLALAVGLLFFFEALARGSATVVAPLTALYPAVAVVLSRIFLREALTLRHPAGLALAMAAVWLLSK